MADSTPTTNGKGKTPATKSATTAKRAPAKTRTPVRAPARTSSATARKASTAIPKWLPLGASITGAVIAVGATLFATRKEWLPRAKQVGEWVENSVHEQVENIASVRSKKGSRNDNDLPVATPHFDTPAVNTAAY